MPSPSPESRVVSVVLTGGPCAGKSTALVTIRDHFEPLGWRVIMVPESATALITAGITPFNGRGVDFQRAVLGLQTSIEAEARRFAQALGGKVLLLFDRGMMDGAAYLPADPFNTLLAERGLSRFQARDCEHDAVLHLVTAAKGARAFYSLENNAARKETIDEAIAADDRVMAAWVGHPHLRVIGNEGTLKTKIHQVLKAIATVLGVPEPIEKERKFLVRLTALPSDVEATRVRIVQSYLPNDGDTEIRLREREQHGEFAYIETLKRPVPNQPPDRFETERAIARAEYHARVASAIAALVKHRHYYPHLDQVTGLHHYLEIDRYEMGSLSAGARKLAPAGAWAIVEVETDIEGAIGLPSWLEVIQEVTGVEEWSNRRMAASIVR